MLEIRPPATMTLCMLLALSIASDVSFADDLLPRATPPKPPTTLVAPHERDESVIIKFAEGTAVRRGALGVVSPALDLKAFHMILLAHGIASDSVTRLFDRPESELDAERELGQQLSRRALADLNLYYVLAVPAGMGAGPLCDALNALPFVEIAVPAPRPAPPPADLSPPTPDMSGGQGYRSAAPAGIAALDPTLVPGGDGAGTSIVDIEYNWVLNHEDIELPPSARIDSATPYDPFPTDQANHGTAVLGILGARTNGYGVLGIAPGSTVMVAPAHTHEYGYDVGRAVNLATSVLGPGDAILIEQQVCVCGIACGVANPQDGLGPVEHVQPWFDAIATATALGIVVVEPAGNGNVNLDGVGCQGRFNRTIRDSGAIIVGAGSPTDRARLSFSSYGSRVDLQGWGSSVTSTGYGYLYDPGDVRQRYTNSFSGTSSASAIVAGAVLALQGAWIAAGSGPLSPVAARDLLVETGTPQGGAAPALEHIGPLPNLRRATMQTPGEQATPTPTVTPTPTSEGDVLACSATPNTACRAPVVSARARFQLRDRSPDAKDTLAWGWASGAATARSEFGDPTFDTDYQLCVYDGSARLIMSASAAAGGLCGTTSLRPCWKPTKKGFQYTNRQGGPDGLRAIVLQEGSHGRAKIRVTGAGVSLAMPPLPVTLPFTVRLQNGEGRCWGATYGTSMKNVAGELKAKSD